MTTVADHSLLKAVVGGIAYARRARQPVLLRSLRLALLEAVRAVVGTQQPSDAMLGELGYSQEIRAAIHDAVEAFKQEEEVTRVGQLLQHMNVVTI